MTRFEKPTKEQIREKIEVERKALKKHQDRMQQLAPHSFVHEYIVNCRKADDCQAEILHLEAQLGETYQPDVCTGCGGTGTVMTLDFNADEPIVPCPVCSKDESE